VERLQLEQLRIKKAQLEQKLRQTELRMSLDKISREKALRETPPPDAEEKRHLDEMFKRKGVKSLNWTGTVSN
jgi:hypothetical protein